MTESFIDDLIREKKTIDALPPTKRAAYVKNMVEYLCSEIQTVLAIEGKGRQIVEAFKLLSKLKTDMVTIVGALLYMLKPEYESTFMELIIENAKN